MEAYSLDIKQDKINKLKEIFPEVFSENKIDWKKLKTTLGKDVIAESDERYNLGWTGKSNCYKVLQSNSSKTLIPNKAESVDFDKTNNLFIEGDNLEVLKTLQKS